MCMAGVIWGTIGPAVDVVSERSSLSVLTIGAYRGVAAVAALGLAVALLGRVKRCLAMVRDAPGRVALVGTATATFQILFFVGVVSVGVSVTTVVCLGFAPVFLLVLSSLRGRRAPYRNEVLTVGVAVAGLLLISLVGGGDSDPSHPVLGVLTALAAGTAYALSAEVAGPLSKGHDALTVAAVTMTVAGLVLVIVGVPAALARAEPMSTPDITSWLLIGYLGLATMAFAYALFFAGLRTTPSGSVVIATLLEPVTAVAIAVLFLGETLTPAGLVGCLFILAAIGTLGRQPQVPATP